VSQALVAIAAIVTGLYILCGVLKQPIVFTEIKNVYLYMPLSTEEGCHTFLCGVAGHLLNNAAS